MKKIILIAAMICGFAVAASAQPRSIGLRTGNGGEVSYQHTLGGSNFIQIDGGVEVILYKAASFNVGATGVYNFMIAQPTWTDRGEWGFYAGPGVSAGAYIGTEKTPNHDYYYPYYAVVTKPYLGAAGMVGLEYTFWFPLQLSVDFRQQVGVAFGSGMQFPSSIGLSARYRF